MHLMHASGRRPFQLSSPPQDAFGHPSWQRAEQAALDAIGRGQSVLLLGQPGTGKSLLLARLGAVLRKQGARPQELRRDDRLDISPTADTLLIDEAGLFTSDQLEQIARLPIVFVMAGLPNLPRRLPSSLVRVTLEKLAPEDVARFVIARLIACGHPPDLFTPESLVALARRSGGLLRLVIILAGAALFFAEQRGAARITADDVEEAASMRVAVLEAPESDAPVLIEKPVCPAVMPTRPRQRRPPRRWATLAGLIGWAGASLATIALAVVAARTIPSGLPIPIQELVERSPPVLAEVVPPESAIMPDAESGLFPAAQVATTFTPTQAVPARSPSPAPAWLPNIVQPDSDLQPPALAPARPLALELDKSVLAFSGPIVNDTMGQSGQLSLQLHATRFHRSVGAYFHASHGLIGTGTLIGEIGPEGRIILSGKLMMGRNEFYCAVQGSLQGDRLVGEATFVRQTSGAMAHSSFTLSKL